MRIFRLSRVLSRAKKLSPTEFAAFCRRIDHVVDDRVLPDSIREMHRCVRQELRALPRSKLEKRWRAFSVLPVPSRRRMIAELRDAALFPSSNNWGQLVEISSCPGTGLESVVVLGHDATRDPELPSNPYTEPVRLVNITEPGAYVELYEIFAARADTGQVWALYHFMSWARNACAPLLPPATACRLFDTVSAIKKESDAAYAEAYAAYAADADNADYAADADNADNEAQRAVQCVAGCSNTAGCSNSN